ncbi:extracellular solute-binding protein [Clostridium estertheticum]|uniref:extracellular solute-binding protein n=1 Tax=Clostridium estertheticum TaxID=238834 RepID=UPI001C7D97C2|nr:extracellular solute-binding protein [Clostridium estertheticum]MBX4271483.1 extracellular solute-binding protein [Clostridium estertheticum]WLC81035.1 extracellular solute-binding protein [Clostridium estertheticum]
MKKTKLIATLALAVGVLATGCGASGSSTGNSKAKGSNSSPGYGLTNVNFPLKNKVNLKFLTHSSALAPSDPNKKLIFQRFEKSTGVHIDWTNYTDDAFNDKRNLEIASGDLPDAIFDTNGLSDNDLLKYSSQGAIIPLDNLINKDMPNLKKILDANPKYKTMITAPDGHIYSLPWIEELGTGKNAIQALDDIPWINKKWLDKLGLPMPTTTDELEKDLLAFKNNAAKLGANVIPMSFMMNHQGEDPAMLLGAFGMGDNDDHYMVTNDKKVVYSTTQPGYKDGIKWLNKLQNEGLIDKEAFTQDWNTYVAKGSANRYGLYFTWDKANITGTSDSYVQLPALKGPDGHINVPRSNGIGFDRGRTVISSSNQNADLTAKWFDLCYVPVQSVQNNWGTYGDKSLQNIFKMTTEGNLKHLPLTGTAPVELRQKTSTGGPLAVLNSYYVHQTTKPDDAAWRLNILKTTYVPYMKATYNYPLVFMNAADQSQVTQLDTAVKTYTERMKAQWILKGGIDADWNSYLTKMDQSGVTKILAIKQKYIDSYFKAQK